MIGSFHIAARLRLDSFRVVGFSAIVCGQDRWAYPLRRHRRKSIHTLERSTQPNNDILGQRVCPGSFPAVDIRLRQVSS